MARPAPGTTRSSECPQSSFWPLGSDPLGLGHSTKHASQCSLPEMLFSLRMAKCFSRMRLTYSREMW